MTLDHTRGRDSSVGIPIHYGLDGPGIESRLKERFSAPLQTSPGSHQVSYGMGIGPFVGVKGPGRDSDPEPPSSANGHERVELHLYAHFGPLWLVVS
jgi:hypothetical protein